MTARRKCLVSLGDQVVLRLKNKVRNGKLYVVKVLLQDVQVVVLKISVLQLIF